MYRRKDSFIQYTIERLQKGYKSRSLSFEFEFKLDGSPMSSSEIHFPSITANVNYNMITSNILHIKYT